MHDRHAIPNRIVMNAAPALRRRAAACLAAAVVIVGACDRSGDGARRATGGVATLHDTSTTADDGSWTMPAKDFASTRFSGLAEITTANVGNLRQVWSFSTGVLRGHEAAPLVVGGTMYVVTPFPNILYALDLKAGGTL